MLLQPLLVLLLASRAVRFCMWPVLEPYWLNVLLSPALHEKRPPLYHEQLEGLANRSTWRFVTVSNRCPDAPPPPKRPPPLTDVGRQTWGGSDSGWR